MTREDAIKVLNMVESHGLADLAKRMAIKALEHPEQNVIAVVPCGDAISRQEALKLFATNDGRYLYEAIRDLPSVTPKQTEITLESAIDYLHSIGWMQKHDKELTEYAEKQRAGNWIETADEYYKAVNEYGGGVNEDTPYFTDNIGCSVCLAMFSTIDNETERFNYCPNCGARMESEEQA